MEVIIVYSCEDWNGIYIDGELANEGHGFDVNETMNLFVENGTPVESFESYMADEDWLEKRGNFPDNFEDVILEDSRT